jgi:hypothetical protein
VEPISGIGGFLESLVGGEPLHADLERCEEPAR